MSDIFSALIRSHPVKSYGSFSQWGGFARIVFVSIWHMLTSLEVSHWLWHICLGRLIAICHLFTTSQKKSHGQSETYRWTKKVNRIFNWNWGEWVVHVTVLCRSKGLVPDNVMTQWNKAFPSKTWQEQETCVRLIFAPHIWHRFINEGVEEYAIDSLNCPHGRLVKLITFCFRLMLTKAVFEFPFWIYHVRAANE